ncbi:MAG: DNA-3-methyladenine glycosylase I [Methanobacterium paludis]|nr:DNA-3-methyladenine glycosylase I [Methanobacterium paludis]
MKKRCFWAKEDPLILEYHDKEWGVPVHDDHRLFEFLILEGAQAGLSWTTILKKRDNYREAFDDFDPAKVAVYDDHKIEELRKNAGIVRNRLKIASAITNAQAVLEIQREFESFDSYIWKFVGGKPIQNRWKNMGDVPSSTTESENMSLDLKKRGFKFVGPTICYAFMQAVGMWADQCSQVEKLSPEELYQILFDHRGFETETQSHMQIFYHPTPLYWSP